MFSVTGWGCCGFHGFFRLTQSCSGFYFFGTDFTDFTDWVGETCLGWRYLSHTKVQRPLLIAIGIISLPAPRIRTHVIYSKLCMPSQLVLCFRGFGITCCDVTRSSIHYFAWNLFSWRTFKYTYYFKDTITVSGSHIKDLHPWIQFKSMELIWAWARSTT